MNLLFYTDGQGNYYKSYVPIYRAPYQQVLDANAITALRGRQAVLDELKADAPLYTLQPYAPNANEQVRVGGTTPAQFSSSYTPTTGATTLGSDFRLETLKGVNIPTELQINPALLNKPAGPTMGQLNSQSNTNLFNTVTAPAAVQTMQATTEKASAGNGWILLLALFGGAYFLRKK